MSQQNTPKVASVNLLEPQDMWKYVDAKLRPTDSAEQAFHQPTEMGRHEIFPMNTAAASNTMVLHFA
jgi:hypothetical protein